MSFLPIYEVLKADPNIALLIDVDKQLHEDMAPHDPPLPYVVWQVISGQANNHLDTPANFDDTQYQLMVFAATRQVAYALRDACRTALESQSWIRNPSINYYDPKTNLYARGFDANWILER